MIFSVDWGRHEAWTYSECDTIFDYMSEQKSSGRPYGGISQTERKVARRDTFIRAGVKVFAAEGYRGATVRKICAEANLTTRYFYESFESVDELFEACYDQVTQKLAYEGIKAASQHPDNAEKRAEAVMRSFFVELKEMRNSARLFLMDVSGINPKIYARFNRTLNWLADMYGSDMHVDSDDDAVKRLVRVGKIGGVILIAREWVGSDFEAPLETVLAAAIALNE